MAETGNGKDFKEGLGGLDEGPRASAAEAQTPFGEAGDAEDHPSVAALKEQFGDAIQHHIVASGDEHVVYVDPERVREILRWLKEDPGQRYLFLSDVTAVDFGGGRPLEVVYQLWSLEMGRQLRLKATLPLSNLEIDSAVPVWRAADWLEREVYDLFGITFRDHPDLRRIMMPDNYAEGHPLRKDFPLRGRFSRAEQTRRALSMEVEDYYTPEELGIAGDKTRYGQEAGDATAAGGRAAGQAGEAGA